ncbi:SGNH/GDSL hydrolase family protein [Spirilliplanes yamanashiensis]|uniref:Lipase 1 n=1 Tax=Spirilliplanes yamanashiensis TaxID=42233 RepID=A0A8J3YCF3_9ACTN|nr:SGNH/GDSL hydrolase family protein [Spirilliplanes yamanashiensis]MDP9818966.1 lysophospholipase L1-like esterase [Spirilliplanes yamanashiensis]GIJ05420.1 lipase 1 [Spirilliplanes yamanashiensis]
MVRRLAALIVLPLLATLLAATPARAASVDYVALGDSYAAGTGATGAGGLCFRSAAGYPGLWAARNDPASYRTVACSGATTADVRNLQLWALSAKTDLVTLTVGGNDAGFVPAVLTCLLGTDAACLREAEKSRSFIRTGLAARLDATYRDVARRAPNATVVVLSYPRLYDEAATTCDMSPAKRRTLNAGADELAAVTRARAAAAGFTYADVRDTFAGHGICARTPWVNPVNVLNPVASFHPNAAGYRGGYLPALSAAL